MKFGMGVFAILASTTTFSSPAFADINIGSASFEEEEACPSISEFDCAPTNDPRLRLDDNPILEKSDAEIWSYIGGLKVDRSGSIPARCVTEDIPSELLVKTRVNTFSINYSRLSNNRFGLGLDMIEALRAAGAADALLSSASAGISAAFGTVGSSTIVADAEYWTYKLPNSEISALKGIGANSQFDRCLRTLASNDDYGLVIAIGGFWIRESRAVADTTRALSLAVTAALRDAGATEEELASMSATIGNFTTQKVTTELADVFEGRSINYLTNKNIVEILP